MRKLITLMIAFICCIGMWAQEHYLVGGCTDSDWETGEKTRSAVRAYTSDGTNWAWAGYINAASDEDGGRFKIPDSSGGWSGFWAKEQNTKITSEGVDLSTDGTDDRKFRLAEVGYYLITFNTRTMKIYAQTLSAASQDGDYYLISSVDDYYWFAAYIASDEHRNAKAKLIADLDFSGKTFIPLASERYPFTGEFDGQCHTIINAVVNVGYSKIGLFSCVSSGANIHDLVIGETCSFSGWAKVAGIAGHALGGGDSVGTVTLRNIINMADVTSNSGTGGNEGHASGFIACCNDKVNLSATNCANTGDINGATGECAAFVGWNGTDGTSFTNCWNIGEIADEDTEVFEDTKHKRLYRGSGLITPSRCYDLGHNDQGSSFSNDDLESGKLCYLLNNAQGGVNWYQNLFGTVDAYPVPFSSHKKVYKFGSADSYLNDGSAVTISSATDLDNFSQVVNAGATSLNANLNAEISATTTFTPIGTSTNMYKGTFDGNGKSIELSINNTNSSVNHRALIGYATGGATIQNLILKGSVKSSGNVTAGFIAEVNGSGEVTITNCGNEAEIRGNGSSGEVAAIIANNYGANGACALKLTNVYNVGDVYGATGTKPSTICGSQNHDDTAFKNVYNYGHVYLNGALSNRFAQFARGALYNGNSVGSYDNCYSTILNETDIQNTQDGDSPDIKKIEDSDVSSGELTCLLNGSTNGGTDFYQSLGTDNYPVLDSSHGKVWKSLCAEHDDEIQYSNSAIGQSTSHVFEESNATGHCTQCQQYFVSTGAQMKSIADGISAGTIDNDIHIYFTQDIDFAGVTGYAGIGTDTDGKRFCGILDGQGHSVINMTINSEKSGVGLIGAVSDGADIKNVIVTRFCKVRGNQYVAGIVGTTNGTGTGTVKITRCGNEADVEATGSGNSNAAGILGCRRGNNRIEISNCYNAGTIKGPVECAGISAWMGTNFSLNKCYNIGSIDSKVENAQYLVRVDNNTSNWNGASSITDCYQINTNNNFIVNDTTYTKSQTTYTIKAISSDVFASGELCYELNGKQDAGTDWYQTLGTDNYPVPFSSHNKVYKFGSADSYLNDGSDVTINSATDLNNFSEMVNAGLTSLNAELTQDIDMSSTRYTPIGTSTNKYTGTFDGQNHSVTLNINTPNESGVGFIAYAYATSEKHAHIKNLTIKGEVNGDSYVAGIIGSLSGTGGEIIFENCGNEANIEATHINAGGIFGCSFDGSVRVRMINCYNAGNITSEKESGQLTGWSTNTEITNCYTIGNCTNCDFFARLGTGTNNIKNCYSDHDLTWNNHPTYVTAKQIENGELCAKLGYGFRQNLGEDAYPNFNVEHGFVNQIGAAGYSTQYNAMSDVTIPDGVEAFAGVKNGSWVTLVRVEDKIKAGVPVVLKGAEGCYNFMPTTDAEAPDKNDLRGSDGSVPFGGNIYVLANKTPTPGIGFYRTSGSGKYVPEGRAYLDNSGSSVKEAYLFSFDDEETAITNVNVNGNGNNAAIYNMAGQRISKLQKGINIVNGKKVLF